MMEIIQVSANSPSSTSDGNFQRRELNQVLVLDSARKRHEMEHSSKFVAVKNLWQSFPRRSLSIAAVIMIALFLRKLSKWDWRDEKYVLRAHKGYYVDPTNLYKYYGTYGNS